MLTSGSGLVHLRGIFNAHLYFSVYIFTFSLTRFNLRLDAAFDDVFIFFLDKDSIPHTFLYASKNVNREIKLSIKYALKCTRLDPDVSMLLS